MEISLSITFRGQTSQFRVRSESLVIGRSYATEEVDIDLHDDTRVSRRHARITWENDKFWLEDLGSRHGTNLNGVEIKGTGKHLFEPLDEVQVGDTKLRFEPDLVPVEARELVETRRVETAEIAGMRRAGAGFQGSEHARMERMLEALSQLPVRLATETKLDQLCQAAVETVVELIPRVGRCALLLKDRDQLSLEAYTPKGQIPAPSERLANRAIAAMKGFIWPDKTDEHVAQYHPVGSGMYAPLIWNEKAIGVLCADDLTRNSPFTVLDLHLLAVLAHYAGMAIAQHTAREALAKQTEFTNRLFSSRFPPSVREGLRRQAADDNLPIGTRRSLVTVLNADIRRFTQLSQELGPLRIGDLLNEYFPRLIEAIFAYGGTVERFAGDGIFAVFGAPEPDDRQQEHAIRAALDMQRTVRELNEARDKQKAPISKIGLGIGIGIDCGEVLNGFIGNAERLEFAIVGDAANYASRYCSGAAAGEILISRNVHARVWKLVDSEARPGIPTKNGLLDAYVVNKLR
ncbi:MAG: FHA domain-containing protein [Verrucomicrobia bacterium]|nr:FHA domain-containing protein [Verrucomicrobiota bacterium]